MQQKKIGLAGRAARRSKGAVATAGIRAALTLPTRRDALLGLAACLAAPGAQAQDVRTIELRGGARLGFDGRSPGPLLRLRKGEALNLRFANAMKQQTALHWQGLRLPSRLDAAEIPPGGALDCAFAPPDSGTFLYRALAPAQQDAGLHGVLIVDEETPPRAGLDVLAVLSADPAAPDGVACTVTALGGKDEAVQGDIPLPVGERVRLRLANACAMRIFSIAFEGFVPLVVAIDGQNCDPFEPVRRTIPVGPGARFEIMFDAAGAGRVVSRDERKGERTLVGFAAAGPAQDRYDPIVAMARNPALPPAIKLQNAKKVDVALAVSGRGFSLTGAGKLLFSVPRGTPVTLGLANKTGLPASFHLHGHCMRLLHDLDDGWEPYWRDCVLANAGKTHHVAFVADNPGRWLLEAVACDPAGAALSTWFEVV